MITDVMIFFQLLAVVILAFTMSLIGMSRTDPNDIASLFTQHSSSSEPGRALRPSSGHFDILSSPQRILSSAVTMPFWAVFGEFDIEELERDAPYSSPIMWVYVLVSNIVLVNLLVAMFSDT